MGKPPDFVLEIGSRPAPPRRDLGPKRDLYARLGVGEYWKYDGTGGNFYGEPLVGEYLSEGGEYRRFRICTTRPTAWSGATAPSLNLGPLLGHPASYATTTPKPETPAQSRRGVRWPGKLPRQHAALGTRRPAELPRQPPPRSASPDRPQRPESRSSKPNCNASGASQRNRCNH